MTDENKYNIKLKKKVISRKHQKGAEIILKGGIGVSPGVASGKVNYIKKTSELNKLKKGEILVAEEVDAGWGHALKEINGIIINRGGRTSHIGVLSRDLGIPCILGTNNATEILKPREGKWITLDSTNQRVYKRALEIEEKEEDFDIRNLERINTKVGLMFSFQNRVKDFSALKEYSSFGGNILIRSEFILLSEIGVYPLALRDHFYGKLKNFKLKNLIDGLIRNYKNAKEYYIEKLSKGIAKCASIFPENDTIIRTLDIKSNEYKSLPGGEEYLEKETNPMMGLRGAYYFISPSQREISRWTIEAVKRAMRMGYKNISLAIPIVRDPLELTGGKELRKWMKKSGKKDWKEWKGVFEIIKETGIEPHKDLKIGIEVEVGTNILRSDEFANVLDFGTFGPNDLTQFLLAVDRECGELSRVYTLDNKAVNLGIRKAIKEYKKRGKKINIVGQNFSLSFIKLLVEKKIDCIGVSVDSYIDTVKRIAKMEREL